jgi:hypothetical protein
MRPVHRTGDVMNPLLVLLPLSLGTGSTLLFLLLDRVRRTHFSEDGPDRQIRTAAQ